MTAFVLDASVTMRWFLQTPTTKDQDYAWRVLEQLKEDEAQVPELWHLEVSNVLLSAEKAHQVQPIESERFIEQLTALPIRADTRLATQAFNRTMAIARSCNLTSYDAAYLELSIRTGLPISTLDRQLRKTAARLDIPIYLTDKRS